MIVGFIIFLLIICISVLGFLLYKEKNKKCLGISINNLDPEFNELYNISTIIMLGTKRYGCNFIRDKFNEFIDQVENLTQEQKISFENKSCKDINTLISLHQGIPSELKPSLQLLSNYYVNKFCVGGKMDFNELKRFHTKLINNICG